MLNKKGFTLVELLATIGILALISLIAIPSVINLTNKNKKGMYVKDAKRFISLVEYESRKRKNIRESLSIKCQEVDHYTYGGVFLDEIDHSDIITSPEGKEYFGFVVKIGDIVGHKDEKGEYYVCLTDGVKTVIGSLTQLNGDESNNYVYNDANCDIGRTDNKINEKFCISQ